jgi:hypothetical protein
VQVLFNISVWVLLTGKVITKIPRSVY